MANNAGFKFVFQQPIAKTAPQPQPEPSSSCDGTVRILMRDGRWLVEPGESPELRKTVIRSSPK
jgi:hypothetical protein